MAITGGTRLVFGIVPPQRIFPLPLEVKRVRIRIRADKPVAAFLLFPDGFEHWLIGPAGNHWKLAILKGVNRRTQSAAVAAAFAESLTEEVAP